MDPIGRAVKKQRTFRLVRCRHALREEQDGGRRTTENYPICCPPSANRHRPLFDPSPSNQDALRPDFMQPHD